MGKLNLQDVTLCAVTSVNIQQTIHAISYSMEYIDFGDILFFTDCTDILLPPRVKVFRIDELKTFSEYSSFLIERLGDYIETEFALIVQWDGFVIDAESWRDDFRHYDYIGASWPQFEDDHMVGNGGFSLRSRKLLKACHDPRFVVGHPEDVSICRTNRPFLESSFDILFAEKAVADQFSFERYHHGSPTFGFHGAFNLIRAVGLSAFSDIYVGLDDKRSVFVDYWHIILQAVKHSRLSRPGPAISIIWRMTKDYLRFRLNPK